MLLVKMPHARIFFRALTLYVVANVSTIQDIHQLYIDELYDMTSRSRLKSTCHSVLSKRFSFHMKYCKKGCVILPTALNSVIYKK